MYWDALVDSDGPLRRGDNGAFADVSRHHRFIRRIWNDGQELLVLFSSQVPDVRLAIGAAAYEDFGILETNVYLSMGSQYANAEGVTYHASAHAVDRSWRCGL